MVLDENSVLRLEIEPVDLGQQAPGNLQLAISKRLAVERSLAADLESLPRALHRRRDVYIEWSKWLGNGFSFRCSRLPGRFLYRQYRLHLASLIL